VATARVALNLAPPLPVEKPGSERGQAAGAAARFGFDFGSVRVHDAAAGAAATAARSADRTAYFAPGGLAARAPAAATATALPAHVRRPFERYFGAALDDVRVHDSPAADAATRRLGAQAVTVGHDIAFAAGAYAPDTSRGRALLAHELTHTLQQGAVEPSRTVGAPSSPGDSAEREAAGATAAFVRGKARAAPVAAAPPRLACFGGRGDDPIHSGMVDRAQQRYPGMPASQVKYATLPPEVMARATPWELGHAAITSFDPDFVSAPTTPPTLEDYRRGRSLINTVFSAFHIDEDIDQPRIHTRDPTAGEARVLGTIMSSLLASSAGGTSVGGRVAAGRGAQMTALIRIATDWIGLAAAVYRLVRRVTGGGVSDADVRALWSQFGVTAAATATVTEPERRLALFLSNRGSEAIPAGVYQVFDDLVYVLVPAGVDIARYSATGAQPSTTQPSPEGQAAQTQFVFAHELSHALGGGETLRAAFRTHYGTSWYSPWHTLEEGMADVVAAGAMPAQARYADLPGGTATQSVAPQRYDWEVDVVRAVIARLGRDVVSSAYFSGVVPDAVFTELDTAMRTTPRRAAPP